MTTDNKPAAQNQGAAQRLDPNQVAQLADAGLAIINHDAGVIPNKVRNLVPGLEQVLIGLVQGKLAIVSLPESQQQVPPPPEKDEGKKDE